MKHLLLSLIDEAYERKTWHGPNLRGALRGITARQAARRPSKGRHSIWELAVHAAYWKYTVRRRMLGEKRGSFPIKGSNWFGRKENLTEKAWRADLALLRDAHSSLRRAIAAAPAASVRKLSPMIYGIAFHDVYHAGQIQLIKRLQQGRKS